MDKFSYANPDALVSLEWLKNHLDDQSIRIIEAVWGREEYITGHIPGAIAWEFIEDMGGTTARQDLASREEIESLLSRSGIRQDSTIIVYSGLGNLLATFAFWLLKLYGHSDVRLLDGGRQKWIDDGYPMTQEVRRVDQTKYVAQPMNWNDRVDQNRVLDMLGKENILVIDARTQQMFEGADNAGTERAGHIPGAKNIPASMELNADGSFHRWITPYVRKDGTFLPKDELQTLLNQQNVTPEKEIITYCVRGGLSTQTWFVLTQLLGFPNVREYERSWEEWGNNPDLPIVQGRE